jgi:hypothetical protein
LDQGSRGLFQQSGTSAHGQPKSLLLVTVFRRFFRNLAESHDLDFPSRFSFSSAVMEIFRLDIVGVLRLFHRKRTQTLVQTHSSPARGRRGVAAQR